LAVTGTQNQQVSEGATLSKFRITVSVEGNDFGVWDKFTGGDLASTVTPYNPGSGPQVPLPGIQTVSPITVSRLYDLNRDHANLPALYDAVGGGTCIVKIVPLDKNGMAFGKAIIWSGILDKVTVPQPDSSSSDPALITLEITPGGQPAGGGT